MDGAWRWAWGSIWAGPKETLRRTEWLRLHQVDEAPPDGYGLWGEVFDSIYHP